MSSARSSLHAHPPPGPSSPRNKSIMPKAHNSLPRLQPSPLPLQAVENSSSARTHLHPSSAGTRKPSPMKPRRRPSDSQPGKGDLGFVPISAPTPPTFTTDSPTKKPPFQTFPSSSMPQSALFTTFPTAGAGQSQKENIPVNDPHNDGFADFPEPSYGGRPPLKRALMEAAPLNERPVKKHKRGDSDPMRLPEPHELPPVEDDGTKPPYSYATLIGMSILRAPHRRLTLAQIYKWISDTFKYYRKCDPGWQNSIRHNLSLNKAFVKQDRPKDDPGKGHYWAIEPGMEPQFLKDKFVRRPTMSSLPLPAAPQGHHVHLRNSGTSTWVVPPPPTSSAPKPSKPVDLSSDATLPASDPALQEDTAEEHPHPAPSHHPPRSSPPQPIHSSPPVAPPRLARHGTPPTPSHIPTTSAAPPRPEKRKSTAMDDSGYFSSLDSSAMRPNKAARIMTSDLDVEPPRIKRGRAEEEIARIRSSSHDISPNHGPQRKSSTAAVGSSPLRGEHVRMLPPPLTPVFKFKKPAKPPASVSPNTNLRNHRKKIQQMVNSPIKHLGLTDEDLPWSPAFNLQDEIFTPNDNFHASFDVFADPVENTSTSAYGSPAKRSAKRRKPDVGNVLADITSVNVNSRMGMPLSSNKSKGLVFPESPSKGHDSDRFVDATDDDFFSFHLFDESPGEVDGVDLLQGFQKIGGAKDERTGRHAPRPTMNPRGNTSLF